MSVYWVSVPELEIASEDSADEAIRHVAKYQWHDLRSERFEERDSSTYRKSVASLAAEIAKRATGVEGVEDIPQASAPSVVLAEDGDDDQPGIIDRIAAGEEVIPQITTILEAIGRDIETVGSKSRGVGDEIEAASNRGQGRRIIQIAISWISCRR